MKRSSNRKAVGRLQIHASDAARSAPIPRGGYLHRQGEVAEDERQIADFWRECGFSVKFLEASGARFSTLPDFLLSRDGKPWAYCEVKTIWQHKWNVRILHEDRASEERTEVETRPVEERLRGDLVTTLRQLRTGNPDHRLLNFVVLVNRDAEASIDLLKRALTAAPPASGRSLKTRMAARMTEEIQQFRHDVDLCLWADGLAGKKPAIEGYFLFNSQLQDLTGEITALRTGKHIAFEPAA